MTDQATLITEYLHSDAFHSPEVMDSYLHPEATMEWQSTNGTLFLNRDQIIELITELNRAYESCKLDVSHVISDGHHVSARYSHYITTMENPKDLLLLAHFMCIWELREEKLYKCWQMSQL